MAEDWKAHALDIATEFAEIGTLFSIRRPVPGEYDPLLGEFIGDSEEQYLVYGLFKNLSSMTSYQQVVTEFSILEGDLIVQLVTGALPIIPEDEIITEPLIPYEPVIGDYITVHGAEYIVKGVTANQPAGIPLLFDVFIRRA